MCAGSCVCMVNSVAEANSDLSLSSVCLERNLLPFFQGHSHISCMPGTVRRWNYPPPLCIGKNFYFEIVTFQALFDSFSAIHCLHNFTMCTTHYVHFPFQQSVVEQYMT